MICRKCANIVEMPDITGNLCNRCWVDNQQIKRPLSVLRAFWDSVIVIEEDALIYEPVYEFIH
jgi:hypothetical protein